MQTQCAPPNSLKCVCVCVEGGGYKLSEPAKLLWKEQAPHPLLTFFLHKNNTQLLQSLIITTQAGLDNAVTGVTSSSLRPAA